MLVGRVRSVQGMKGEAEFTQHARMLDLIYYRLPGNRKVMCQITNLKSSPMQGYYGEFRILDSGSVMPKPMAELYLQLQPLDTGRLDIGTSTRDQTVKLMVNPFFRHVLIVGITSAGKTHTLIVLEEELLKQHVPSLVIDTHGELIHLNEFSPDAIVTEELRFEDLLGYLKQKKTVVYNLQGLPKSVKANRAYEVLSQLWTVKEQDYKSAENDVKLLEIPPVLIAIDEAEIYAPLYNKSAPDPKCKEALVNIAEEGSKYGLGLIVAVQRPPRLELEVRSQCNSAIIFHVYDEGSRKVLRALPYISSAELNRVKNTGQGTCLITGLIVEHPLIVNIRDIKTRRAKATNFEAMLGLQPVKIKEEPEPPEEPLPQLDSPRKASLQVVTKGASVEAKMLCPDCHKPLEYNRGKLICKTNGCSVIEVKNGKVIRSAIPSSRA